MPRNILNLAVLVCIAAPTPGIASAWPGYGRLLRSRPNMRNITFYNSTREARTNTPSYRPIRKIHFAPIWGLLVKSMTGLSSSQRMGSNSRIPCIIRQVDQLC